jgi:tol-pal system protein YbgF
MIRYSVAIGSLILVMLAGGCASRGEVSRLAERMSALEKSVVLAQTETATLTQETNDLDKRLAYLEDEAQRRSEPAASWGVSRPAPIPAAGSKPVPPTVPQKPSGQATALVASPAGKASSLPAPVPETVSPADSQTHMEELATVASLPPSPAPEVAQSPPGQPAPMASTPTTTEKNAYELARQLYVTGRFAEAEAAFQAFLEVYPASKLVPNALYWKGETFYSRGRYSEAIFAFKDVQTRFPKDAKTPDSLLKTAMAYQKLGDPANTSLHLAVLFEDWPKAEATQRAKSMGLKL